MTKLVLTALAALFFFAGSSGRASAEDVMLRWIRPADSRIVGFNVYVARARLGPIVTEAIDVGRPSVDASGISRARLIGFDRSMVLGIEMTSYDSLRRESARSNRVFVDPGGDETLDAAVWSDDFESSPVASTPVLFTDPSGRFRVSELLDGNRALEAHSASGLVSAHYDGADSLDWGNYEVAGRLMLLKRTAIAGVAVRADTQLGSYFGFGGDGSGTLTLSQVAKAPLSCGYTMSMPEGASVLRWLRFRLRVTDPLGRTRLRAKVWPVGEPEPVIWQSDCWTSVVVPLPFGEFAFYRAGSGSVYWDDLSIRPVVGSPDPIPLP